MNKNVLAVGLVILAIALFAVGFIVGRSRWSMQPGSMMTGNDSNSPAAGYGMMGGDMMNSSMMMNSGQMMNGGQMMSGMMNGLPASGLYQVEPLSLEEARAAVADYLSGLDNDDLTVGRLMVFDNHAYAQIMETSSGIGAFTVLVDPVILAVTPEPGPNMMWNIRYSPMSDAGMMGMIGSGQGMAGMMGDAPADVSADMPVSAEEAISTAQRYLDAYLPGTTADDTADPFYGYYTVHVRRGEQIIGLLSVNGYTRQVFPHTWHGDLLDTTGE